MNVNFYVAKEFASEPHAYVIAQFINEQDAVSFYKHEDVCGMDYNLYTTNYGGIHSVLMTPTG